MFVSFFLPTFVSHSQLSHQLYRQMGVMGPENLHVIAPAYYFKEHTQFPQSHHILQPWLQKQFYHPYPTQQEIDVFGKSTFPDTFLTDLTEYYYSDAVLYNVLQSESIPSLVTWIRSALDAVAAENTIEGILTWRDCASLAEAARQLSIPVIYNELGPFRNPTHHETFFWDTQGVKNSTELEQRFMSTRSNNTLRAMCEEWAQRLLPSLFNPPAGNGCAVLMACEEDFAFMRGLSNYRLLAYAKEQFPDKHLVARPHPLGKNVRYLDTEYDDSANLDHILHTCERAITIYSNAGIELLAQGLRVDFLGDTPLRFLSATHMPASENAWRVGFFCLNYLVPGQFMFNPEYYRWRLSGPAEQDIMERHINVWEEATKADTPMHLFYSSKTRRI